MSVKRYGVGFKDSESGRYVAMLDKQDGGYVSYEDYAALEQQLAESHRALRAETTAHENLQMQVEKLAAENAGLKAHGEALAVDNAALREVVERMINQFAMSGISPEEKSINPAKSLMFDAKSALFMPATDAFLAEVRAQGVDVARNAMIDFVEGEVGPNENVPGLIRAAEICVSIAANLRKGVQS